MYDEDEDNNEGRRPSFSNAAIQRQVNYTNDSPIDIDYLMLDRLNKLFEQAKKCGISSLPVKDELMKRRAERLNVLCKELEIGEPYILKCRNCDQSRSCADCKTYIRGSGDNFYIDTLRRFAGFFAIQCNLTSNLETLFGIRERVMLWDSAMISLKKSFELAMKLSNYDEMLPLKKTMLIFCLSMQDLGVTTA